MLKLIKNIYRKLDEAAKRYTTTCPSCKTVMQGHPLHCEHCGLSLTGSQQ